jgi:hypothetical protein
MKSFSAQQDSTGAYINLCQRRFRRAWQLSKGEQKQEPKKERKRALIQKYNVDIQGSRFGLIDRRCQPGRAARVGDSFLRAGRYLGASITRTNPRPSYRLTVPHASRSPLAWACGSHIPLWRNETRRHHHLCADQRLLEADARECQALALIELAAMVISIIIDQKSKRRGVGGNPSSRRIATYSSAIPASC